MFVRKILPYLSFFTLCAVLTTMVWLKPDHSEADMVGLAFPELSIPLLSGTPKANDSGYKIYNFFASWCTPCHAELPELKALSEQSGIPIIGISWDQNPNALQEWLTKNTPPFVAIYDDNKGAIGHAIALRGLPETYLVDAKGIIRYHQMGAITTRDIPRITQATHTK